MNYFWIAEYNDGTIFPQFENRKENFFKDIDQSKLIRFGWYPFSKELPKYVINLNKDDILIAKRRNYIQRIGNQESRNINYLLGTQNYIICIDEEGKVISNGKY